MDSMGSTLCKTQQYLGTLWGFYSVLVTSVFQRECCFHISLQTPFWQLSRSAPVAVKLPSLTSPLAIINHVTHGMKSSGSAAISGHPCIYMTIQRDLPASRCVSQSLCLCLHDFIAWWRCGVYVDHCTEIPIQKCRILTGKIWLLVNMLFKWCFIYIWSTKPSNLFYDIVYRSSFRWLPSTTSSSDRSWPGSCVCVSLRRAGPGHQWSQRSVYISVSLPCHCRQERKEVVRDTRAFSWHIGIHTVSYLLS